MNQWLGLVVISLLSLSLVNAQTLCEVVGLADYPSQYTAPALPAGYAQVCWLSLGSTDVQRSSATVITAGGTMTTTYSGIGVAVAANLPTGRHAYRLAIMTNDFNGATTTGTQNHYTSQAGVPFGAAFSCVASSVATSYIDLRHTEFVVDRGAATYTASNIFTACGGVSASSATLAPVWPYYDDIVVTATGGSTCGSMASNMFVTGSTCDNNAWTGGNANNEVRIYRLIKLGNSIGVAQANTPTTQQSSVYYGVVACVSTDRGAGGAYITNIQSEQTMYYAVDNGVRTWSPNHAVPFGAAFACGTTASSVVDLRNTGWSIDFTQVTYAGYGNGNTATVIDQSNPQLVYITATSTDTACAAPTGASNSGAYTSTTAVGTTAWAGQAWNLPITYACECN